MTKPVVAIVGRPNVGKSTFFNRCIGARHAIVDSAPGVTRDRIYHETDWAGKQFLLVDTGGITDRSSEEITNEVYHQVELALHEADVIVFMVDGKAGLIGADKEVANMLRRSQKPVILAVNKIDTPLEEINLSEFYELGLTDPISLSAMRGTGGVGDLLDKIVFSLPKLKIDEPVEPALEGDEPILLAIVGRPNVGKSSMLNVLCGTNRMIVASAPGTTRDAIDTKINFNGKEMIIIDTAGIRRKSKVEYGVEAFSVVRSLRAIGRADVVALMLDATEEITDQDKKIAKKIEEAGKAAVIVLNKWDLVENRSSHSMKQFTERALKELRNLNYAEVLFVSALTKQRSTKILMAAEQAYQESKRRIGTGLLNQIVNESIVLSPPPASKRGKRLKIYYSTQVSMGPPTFVLFVNDGKLMTRNYELYLERKIREAFGFKGTPLKILTRAKKGNKSV